MDSKDNIISTIYTLFDRVDADNILLEAKKAVIERRPIDLKKDAAFKSFFTRAGKESDYLRNRFISSVIGSTVVESKVMNPEISLSLLNQKASRMDIMCVLKDGTRVNIEMQKARQRDSLKNRLLYYVSCLCETGVGKGESYDDMKHSHQIVITGFDMFCDGVEDYHRRFIFKDSNNKPFSDLMQIHILDLSKLPNAESWDSKTVEKLSDAEFFGILIKESNNLAVMDKLKSAVRFMEEMDMADTAKYVITDDLREWAIQFSLDKMERDALAEKKASEKYAKKEGFEKGHKAGFKKGMKEGMEQGLKEGREEGMKLEKINSAILAITKGGMSVDFASEVFDVPLESLQEKLKEIQS